MINREEAFILLRKYLKDEESIKYSLAVEAVLKEMAKILYRDEELWGLTGLLHNLDYEYTPANPSPGFAYAFAKAFTIAKKTPEDLAKLRRAGLGYINMGMETGCEELLNWVKPDLTLKDLETAIHKLDDVTDRVSHRVVVFYA